MDITQFIENNGQRTILNPNYNPKSKKNKEARTLIVPDINTPSDPVLDLARTDALSSTSVDSKEADKYRNYGLNWNPREANARINNLDSQLADAQSNWEKAFNSLGQTVVSEIGLGTLMGFTDLFDFVASKVLGVADDDYQNPASQTLKEWQETFNNEIAPIHTKGYDISNGGLKDFGWWMQNMPQIASSLTLLIPARGITGAVGLVGKGARALRTSEKGLQMANKLSKVGRSLEESSRIARGISKGGRRMRNFVTGASRLDEGRKLTSLQSFMMNPIYQARMREGLKLGADALLMRTMENYQEARDVYSDIMGEANNKFSQMSDEELAQWVNDNPNMAAEMEEQGIDTTSRDQISRYIAKRAADRDFVMNFGNVIFDVIQLHGLKDIGRGITKLKPNISTFRIAQEERKAIGSALEAATQGAKKATENLTKLGKASALTKDFIRGSWKPFLEESSEGVEEAVNFISQQEGLSYGKMLLDGKDDEASSYLDTYNKGWENARAQLNEYMKDPQLYESAFWGWIGGLVFGAGGSAINRAQNYFYNKANQKKIVDPITGESRVENNSDWFDLMSMGEEKAAITAIQNRGTKLQTASQLMDEIENKGKNPFGRANDDGTLPNFEGDENQIALQKEIAKARVRSNFRYELAMDAMNSGTFNSLLDYVQAEPVKQAMIESGLATEEDIEAFTTETVNDLNHAKEIYENETANVASQLTEINTRRKFGEEAPVESILHIAKENARRRFDLETIDKQINAVEAAASAVEADGISTGKFNIEQLKKDKETVKTAMYTDLYGRIQADINYLQEHQNEENKVDTLLQLKHLNTQRDAVGRLLLGINPEDVNGRARLYNAAEIASRYVRGEEEVTDTQGKTKKEKYYGLKQKFQRTDAEIEKAFEEQGWDYNNEEQRRNILNQAAVQQEEVEKLVRNNPDESGEHIQGLRSLSPRLFGAYADLAQLALDKAYAQSQIATTREEVEDKLDYWFNETNEVRKKTLATVTNTITDLYEKYINADNKEQVRRNFREIITDTYFKNKPQAREMAESFMSKNDAAKLMDVLDIFKYGVSSNAKIFSYFNRVFAPIAEAEARAREKSSISQNNVEGSETSSPIETSSTDTELNTDDGRGQIDGVSPLETLPQASILTPQDNSNGRNKTNTKIILNGRGQLVEVRKSNSNLSDVPLYENENGTYELDVNSLSEQDKAKYLFSGMFDGEDLNSIDPSTPITIKDNPLFTRRGNKFKLYQRGTIAVEGVDNSETVTPVEETNPSDEPQTKYKVGDVLQSPHGPVEITGIEEGFYEYKQVNGNQEDLIETDVVDSNGREWYIENTDTNPETETQAGVGEEAILPTGVPEVATPNIDDTVEVPTIDETPEVEGTPTKVETEEDEEGKIDKVAIRNGIISTAAIYMENANIADIDLDELSGFVKGDLKGKAYKVNLTEDELEKEIDDYIETLRTAQEYLKSNTIPINNGVVGLAMASRGSELLTEDTGSAAVAFAKAMETFMDEYEKVIIVPNIDGKRTIKMADLLYFCNQIFADKNAAYSMYDNVKAYLLSPDGQSKYLLLDKADVLNDKVLVNASKTKETQEEVAERTQTQSIKINTDDAIKEAENENATSKEDRLEFIKAFNGIQKGDKLNMYYDGSRLTFTKEITSSDNKKKEITIGSVPIPRIVNGRYVQYNNGWRCDITRDGKGNIISDMRDIMVNIFTAKGKDYDELRKIIFKASTIKNTEIQVTRVGTIDPLGALLTGFEQNKIISDIIAKATVQYKANPNGYENIVVIRQDNNLPDTRNMLLMLARLYAYTTDVRPGVTRDVTTSEVKRSIDKWFDRLYNEWDAISKVTNSGTVEVSYANEGQFTYANDKTAFNYDDYNVASKALAPSTEAHLAFAKNGVLKVSGKTDESLRNAQGTFVVVYSRNPQPDFVKITGVRLDDKALTSNPKFSTLMQWSNYALQKALYEYLEPTFNKQNQLEIVSALQSILKFETPYNTIPLLRCRQGNYRLEVLEPGSFKNSPRMSAINITYNDNGVFKTFRIFTHGKNAKTLGYQIIENGKTAGAPVWVNRRENMNIHAIIADSLFKWLEPSAQINVSDTGVMNDNISNPNLKGFITTENGKVVVQFGDKATRVEYDSYSDFIIKNDLIKVNAKISENGTNFEKSGSSQRANQTIFVNLQVQTAQESTPTSTTNTPQTNPVKATSSPELYQSLVDKIGTDGNTNGEDLLDLVLDDDERAKLEEVKKQEGILESILPTRIGYDSQLEKLDDENKRVKDGGVNAYSRGSRKEAKYYHFENGESVRVHFPARFNTIIGPTVLNNLSSNDKRNRKIGLRTLIHERIHELIQANPEKREVLIKNMSPIYDELMGYVEQDLKLPETDIRHQLARNVKNALIDNTRERVIEELITNTMTNSDFFHYMNEIIVDNAGEKSESLFAKIARAIANFFGWEIKDNSLYHKAINNLTDVLSIPNVSAESQVQVEGTTQNSEELDDFEKISRGVDISKYINNNENQEPVETNNEPVETNNEPEDEFAALGKELDNYEDYEDADESRGEELPIGVEYSKDGFVKIESIEAYTSVLPSDAQAEFKNMVNSGLISYKC